jgi:acyl-CoA synthetase (AMP-forming)/AMP-acid ligase II
MGDQYRKAAKNLGEILTKNAEEIPGRTAVIDRSRCLGWSEIDERTNRLANALAARGVSKGDRVAFLLQNDHHWLETTFATLKLGAVVVPLSWRMSAGEQERVVDDSSPSAVILSDAFLELCRDLPLWLAQTSRAILIGQGRPGTSSYEELIDRASPDAPETKVFEDDLACISFTSGTTGSPKGVMWTHGTLLSTIPDNPFPAHICRHSRQMLLAPTFVAGALIQLLNGVYNGATLILRDFDPAEVMGTIEQERPTLMACAAVMLRLLASMPEATERDTSSLKRIYYGGATIGSHEDFQRMREVFACDFQEGYGSAETAILITRLDPEDHKNLGTNTRLERLRSAGRAAPGARVKLVGTDGQAVPPEGGVGEVAVKAPWVMKGYWNRPVETEKVFDREGYYLTGDMGAMDRDGYLFIVERKDDMIKTGGLNVYPSEVEGVLMSHPAMEEAAVIGLPHPKWETAVAAVVRAKPGREVSHEDLRNFCKKKIGSYKIPKAFFTSQSLLPRSPLGKLQRKSLRESYTGEAKRLWEQESRKDPGRQAPQDDPLRYCRRCEFQEICQKFCTKYFE